MKKVYTILNRCLGCEECLQACAKEHNWVPRNQVNYTDKHLYPLPVRCAHCEDAPCIAVCPKEAISKNEQGIVVIDENKCIGCTSCINVCPYGVPVYDLNTKKAVKCDLCIHITSQKEGAVPACVENCPTEAIIYIDEEEYEKMKKEEADNKIKEGTPSCVEWVAPVEG